MLCRPLHGRFCMESHVYRFKWTSRHHAFVIRFNFYQFFCISENIPNFKSKSTWNHSILSSMGSHLPMMQCLLPVPYSHNASVSISLYPWKTIHFLKELVNLQHWLWLVAFSLKCIMGISIVLLLPDHIPQCLTLLSWTWGSTDLMELRCCTGPEFVKKMMGS